MTDLSNADRTDYRGWVRAALVNWANRSGAQIGGAKGELLVIRGGKVVARVVVTPEEEGDA